MRYNQSITDAAAAATAARKERERAAALRKAHATAYGPPAASGDPEPIAEQTEPPVKKEKK